MATTKDVRDVFLEELAASLDKAAGNRATDKPVEVDADSMPKKKRKPPFRVPKGMIAMSKLLKVPLKKDFAIDVIKGLNEEDMKFIPDTEAEFVPHIPSVAALILGMQHNERILVTGPTGSGKSTMVRYVCNLMGWPMMRINSSGDMDSSHWFGQYVVENGSTKWIDGIVPFCMKNGLVLNIDEWDVTPPEIMMVLNPVLEGSNLVLKEQAETSIISPHKNFRVVCTGNTNGTGDYTGRYSGTTPQNASTLDRFGTAVILDYMDEKEERQLIKGHVPKLDDDKISDIMSICHFIRKAHKQGSLISTMSPRTLVAWAAKTVMWDDPIEAFRYVMFNKLNTEEQKEVNVFLNKVYAKSIEV